MLYVLIKLKKYYHKTFRKHIKDEQQYKKLVITRFQQAEQLLTSIQTMLFMSSSNFY